jgi:tetratricopeptide (TPR) repeat protein
MDDALAPSAPLPLLARLYRERRSGVLSIGTEATPLRLLLRDGQVVGLGPVPAPSSAPPPPLPGPDDSARIRLERVLTEIGIRPRVAKPAPVSVTPPRNLRGQLLEALADGSLNVTFDEGADSPADVAETAGATEPLILEAVRQMRDTGAVRSALGDLDQRLVATAAMAEERTLTLTEGYLLSRIDGLTSARQVLQLVPLDPDETERTLLGLVLTGRVEYRAAPAPLPLPVPEAEETPLVVDLEEPVSDPPGAEDEPEALTPPEAFPEVLPVASEESWPQLDGGAQPSAAEPDADILARRKEILEIFQSLPLKNHFEVLGVEPGCNDADVKRAYATMVKRFHPDVRRDPRVEDLHDILEAIFIRVGEAWEVLGDARSRASYEARFGVAPRAGKTPPPPEKDRILAQPQSPPPPTSTEYVPPEDLLFKARLLLSQARYWEAIHVLESTVPQMEERRHQHKGRILLARAYGKNPNWVRLAEETLQKVVREDPVNVDAHYELGLLYKAGGLTARAQAMFRRVLELRPEHREAAAELSPGDGPGGGLLKRLFGRGKAS